MSSVGKIFGDSTKYFEFYNWAKESCNWLCDYFSYTPEEVLEGLTYGDYFTLTNLPSLFDAYLVAHCPIPWVLERISEQYGKSDFKSIAKEDYLERFCYNTYIPEQIQNWVDNNYPNLPCTLNSQI